MSKATQRRKLAGPQLASERHQGFRAVGLAVSKLAAPVVAKHGRGVLVRLKADWSAIVGPEWALSAWPIAFARGGVLKLRIVPTAALELQHRSPLLIGRINLYLAPAAVSRLVLVQAALPLGPEPHASESRLLLGGETEAPDPHLSHIADPGLQAALRRLARAVKAAGS